VSELQERFDLRPPSLDRAREPGRLGHVRVDAGPARTSSGELIPVGGRNNRHIVTLVVQWHSRIYVLRPDVTRSLPSWASVMSDLQN
jgi:hypothetical protein